MSHAIPALSYVFELRIMSRAIPTLTIPPGHPWGFSQIYTYPLYKTGPSEPGDLGASAPYNSLKFADFVSEKGLAKVMKMMAQTSQCSKKLPESNKDAISLMACNSNITYIPVTVLFFKIFFERHPPVVTFDFFNGK